MSPPLPPITPEASERAPPRDVRLHRLAVLETNPTFGLHYSMFPGRWVRGQQNDGDDPQRFRSTDSARADERRLTGLMARLTAQAPKGTD